ncbi:MAG: hypothetical protein DMG76_34945 [Acidobacteria bacterium]|nr:MAG: hypothetical protein DMG76_34945 [Acidobacteriota bacterium]
MCPTDTCRRFPTPSIACSFPLWTISNLRGRCRKNDSATAGGLEVVSKWGTRPLDCCPAERAATGPLYPRRLHGAASSRASGAGQQEGLLRPVVPRHCRDLARGRGRPRTSRRTDRFLGCAAQLHSWGQNLLFHPHLHCLIPAGGLSPDHTRWIHPRYPFFLPVGAYSVGSFAASSSTLSNDDSNNTN